MLKNSSRRLWLWPSVAVTLVFLVPACGGDEGEPLPAAALDAGAPGGQDLGPQDAPDVGGVDTVVGDDDLGGPADDTNQTPQDAGATDTSVADDVDEAVDAAGPEDAGTVDPPDVSEDVAPADIDLTEPAPGERACPLNTRVGTFEMTHAKSGDFDYAAASGEIASGVIPLTVLQEAGSLGSCRLMQKKNPFCDPSCAAGELCDHDNSCVAYPDSLAVGTVTVQGLVETLVMEPKSNKSYFDTTVPWPLFEMGAVVTLSATGDELPGFTLNARGVANLEVAEGVLEFVDGQDLTVEWVPSDGPGYISARINIDQHGNSPMNLICDLEDTGSYTIASSLVTDLLSAGVSGFATFQMWRRSVDSIQLEPGCVELRVESYINRQLTVAGHTACQSDADCEGGQICNVPINTCVDP